MVETAEPANQVGALILFEYVHVNMYVRRVVVNSLYHVDDAGGVIAFALSCDF